jgi:hypothetical protein
MITTCFDPLWQLRKIIILKRKRSVSLTNCALLPIRRFTCDILLSVLRDTHHLTNTVRCHHSQHGSLNLSTHTMLVNTCDAPTHTVLVNTCDAPTIVRLRYSHHKHSQTDAARRTLQQHNTTQYNTTSQNTQKFTGDKKIR